MPGAIGPVLLAAGGNHNPRWSKAGVVGDVANGRANSGLIKDNLAPRKRRTRRKPRDLSDLIRIRHAEPQPLQMPDVENILKLIAPATGPLAKRVSMLDHAKCGRCR